MHEFCDCRHERGSTRNKEDKKIIYILKWTMYLKPRFNMHIFNVGLIVFFMQGHVDRQIWWTPSTKSPLYQHEVWHARVHWMQWITCPPDPMLQINSNILVYHDKLAADTWCNLMTLTLCKDNMMVLIKAYFSLLSVNHMEKRGTILWLSFKDLTKLDCCDQIKHVFGKNQLQECSKLKP